MPNFAALHRVVSEEIGDRGFATLNYYIDYYIRQVNGVNGGYTVML